ncbi:MAG: D-ribose pyranase [bacterium]
MKKTGVLNQELSRVIAGMGHRDSIVICDAGLPIPASVCRIDLALEKDLPSFLDTVRVILSELQVEEAVIASEMGNSSPQIRARLLELLPGVCLREVSHEQLKLLCIPAKAVVRTGEFTPYANVVLFSGVIF